MRCLAAASARWPGGRTSRTFVLGAAHCFEERAVCARTRCHEQFFVTAPKSRRRTRNQNKRDEPRRPLAPVLLDRLGSVPELSSGSKTLASQANKGQAARTAADTRCRRRQTADLDAADAPESLFPPLRVAEITAAAIAIDVRRAATIAVVALRACDEPPARFYRSLQRLHQQRRS